MNDIICPDCKSKNVIKKGMRKVKFGRRQLLSCKDCGRKFAVRRLKNKTYGPRVIINAISCYNLGNTLEKSAKLTNMRFKVCVSKSSVHQWLTEFSGVCTYNKIRAQVMDKYGEDVLFSKTFEHNGLSYNFRYHKPKLDILCSNGFSGLAEYVNGFEEGCPKYFGDIENRCSQMKIDIDVKRQGRFNNACKLAGLALKSAKNNRERHPVVENFMLINDSSTVACEVPVWLFEKNLNTGINGHVDVLQVRNGLVYILDFKPDAAREKVEKVASQLFFYASGLSFRTGIKLDKFRCAWFDEKVYYEFEPARANVKFPGSKHRSQILKGKVLNFVSRVSSRSWKGSGRALRENRH